MAMPAQSRMATNTISQAQAINIYFVQIPKSVHKQYAQCHVCESRMFLRLDDRDAYAEPWTNEEKRGRDHNITMCRRFQKWISLSERRIMRIVFLSKAHCGHDNETFVMIWGFNACVHEAFTSKPFRALTSILSNCCKLRCHKPFKDARDLWITVLYYKLNQGNAGDVTITQMLDSKAGGNIKWTHLIWSNIENPCRWRTKQGWNPKTCRTPGKLGSTDSRMWEWKCMVWLRRSHWIVRCRQVIKGTAATITIPNWCAISTYLYTMKANDFAASTCCHARPKSNIKMCGMRAIKAAGGQMKTCFVRTRSRNS